MRPVKIGDFELYSAFRTSHYTNFLELAVVTLCWAFTAEVLILIRREALDLYWTHPQQACGLLEYAC